MQETKSKVSKKQLEANKRNAVKGGVKTDEGKEVIKSNAIKHGLSSNAYDKELEQNLISEYGISGSLEKMLVRNTCISKKRYEKGVELESQLLANIITPPQYEKVYDSQEEYQEYRKELDSYIGMIGNFLTKPEEPKYTMKKIEGTEFEYDKEKIAYLISVIGKYNYQNETRLTKNISTLIEVIKK